MDLFSDADLKFISVLIFLGHFNSLCDDETFVRLLKYKKKTLLSLCFECDINADYSELKFQNI